MGGFNSGLFHGTTGSPQLMLPDDAMMDSANASIQPMKREELLNRATTDEAFRLVRELYREGAGVGDGGTADAIRKELASGDDVGGKSHIRKGRERLRQIERILKKNPDHPDRALLEELRDELRDALEGN